MPNFIKTELDETNWRRAKSIIQEQYPDIKYGSESFWKLVNHVYFSIYKSKKKIDIPLKKSLENDDRI